jgi:hypothetical protein
MTDRPEKSTAKRRDVLKLVGLAPVAGAAALAGGRPANSAPAKPAARGYRESEHIRKYYESARS